MQRNHFCQKEIQNGFFIARAIESTQMDQEQIELPKLATGKSLEKRERWCPNVLHPLSLVAAKHLFSILVGRL